MNRGAYIGVALCWDVDKRGGDGGKVGGLEKEESRVGWKGGMLMAWERSGELTLDELVDLGGSSDFGWFELLLRWMVLLGDCEGASSPVSVVLFSNCRVASEGVAIARFRWFGGGCE